MSHAVHAAVQRRFLLLPQICGLGYYSYSPVDRQYGTAGTIAAIIDTGKQSLFNHAPDIGIGDMSFEHGGHMSPHASHKDGKCVDIRPLRTDGHHRPVTIFDQDYDREATRLLIQSLLAHRNVRRILFNDSQIKGVHHWPGHDNHLHVIMRH